MARRYNPFALWIQAVRAPFFTTSIIPVVFAATLASWYGHSISWRLFPAMLLTAVLFHAGTNLLNDYYDFKRGVDRTDSFGSSRVLVDKLIPPRHILLAGNLCFLLGLALGLTLVAERGMTLLVMGVIGLLGGYLYTGKPAGLKYAGFGDALVFFFMGPFLAMAAYFTFTGRTPPGVIYASLPIGFLAAAILHSNNIRDIDSDKAAGIKTFALILGLPGAQRVYYFLLAAAYLSVAVMVAACILPLFTLSVLVTLPIAAKNIKTIRRANEKSLNPLAFIDVHSAQLHLAFGTLYILSLTAAAVYAR